LPFQALLWAKQQKERGSVESVHVIMVAYAALGDKDGCLEAFLLFKEFAFRPSATSINIMLAAIVYSNDSVFNFRLFSQLHETYFERGELVEDRFTFTQILLACQKTGDFKLATETFNRFLTTNMRITPLMRDTMKAILGGKEYNFYYTNLERTHRKRLADVDKDDEELKQRVAPAKGNVEAVVTLPAALGGKRVYNYIPKTEPFRNPGKTDINGRRQSEQENRTWVPHSAPPDPARKTWSPKNAPR
jgi:hypothetical protein